VPSESLLLLVLFGFSLKELNEIEKWQTETTDACLPA